MNKILNVVLLVIFVFLSSCAEFRQSVKRGLTGEKKNTTDEFLVKKKDPLILPPDFEDLPMPDERDASIDEASSFEKSLESSIEDTSSSSSSVEELILKKIQRK